MSSIKDFVLEVEQMNSVDPEPPVKFSVSLNHIDNFRLQYIAKRLGYNRASLSGEFLRIAINDAETALGLNPLDKDSDYGKEFYKCLTPEMKSKYANEIDFSLRHKSSEDDE